MSYSVEQTRQRLALHYLALPLAAAVVMLWPRYELLTGLELWFLLPLWVVLAHPLVGVSYFITSGSTHKGWVLCRSSVAAYGSEGSLVHLQAALLTALAEEIVFRYAALFELAERLESPLVALLVTSALFTLMHYRLGLSWTSALRYGDLFLFALLLGGLALGTRSLWPPLLLHGMRNYLLRCMLISREEYEKLHGKAEQAGSERGASGDAE